MRHGNNLFIGRLPSHFFLHRNWFYFCFQLYFFFFIDQNDFFSTRYLYFLNLLCFCYYRFSHRQKKYPCHHNSRCAYIYFLLHLVTSPFFTSVAFSITAICYIFMANHTFFIVSRSPKKVNRKTAAKKLPRSYFLCLVLYDTQSINMRYYIFCLSSMLFL